MDEMQEDEGTEARFLQKLRHIQRWTFKFNTTPLINNI